MTNRAVYTIAWNENGIYCSAAAFLFWVVIKYTSWLSCERLGFYNKPSELSRKKFLLLVLGCKLHRWWHEFCVCVCVFCEMDALKFDQKPMTQLLDWIKYLKLVLMQLCVMSIQNKHQFAVCLMANCDRVIHYTILW